MFKLLSLLFFSPKAPLYNMNKHEDKILAVDWSIPDIMLSGGSDNNLNLFRHSAGINKDS